MANKDERNLNITLKNEESENREEIIISFSAFMTQLKRFLIFWLVSSILLGILIPVLFAVFTAEQHKNLNALISFNYSGIEQGLAPDGNKFDINTVKNPEVIKQTLTELDLPLNLLEKIRQGISFEGIVPANAIDRITVYKSAYDQGNIKAAEAILDTSYYPTQYRVTFNYSFSALPESQAVDVFNHILENYGKEFFKDYGFNDAIGSAIAALDYQTYDYPQQIDVFNSSLRSMQNYINTLSQNDTTRFRSTVTGYTFADLSQAIQTIRDVDLSVLSSEILNNTITKDKNALMDYYTLRVEALTREVAVAESELEAINTAIRDYQLGTVIIYGESGQGGAQYSTNSDEYDKLFDRKVSTQNTLATKRESLKDYQKRLNMLKAQNPANTTQIDRIEKEMTELNTKVLDLLNKVNATANEYYSTVYLTNSYSILVPASASALKTTKSIVRSCLEPLIVVEALLFVLYFGWSFVYSLVLENRKRRHRFDADKMDEEIHEKEAETEAVPQAS